MKVEKEASQKEKQPKKKETPKQDPKEKKIEELTNLLKTVQADFENYKKRVEKERGEVINYAKEQIIAKLLPVLDSFEFALKTDVKNPEFEKGIKMIFVQLVSVLHKEGLHPIDTNGKKFDPYKHEVMLQEECDGKEEDIILEELQKGYQIGGKVVRHSKVKICKKIKKPEKGE